MIKDKYEFTGFLIDKRDCKEEIPTEYCKYSTFTVGPVDCRRPVYNRHAIGNIIETYNTDYCDGGGPKRTFHRKS